MPASPNLELLTAIARALGQLRERLVFVGGCATALLVTDPAAQTVRATTDVDAIVEVAGHGGYRSVAQDLMALGFGQTAAAGEPPYRWTLAGMQLDVVPTDPGTFGFSNPWYAAAWVNATDVVLAPDLRIRLIGPTYFVATKLVAFLDRGRGDFLASHDLEDILSVVDGRPGLIDEFRRADQELCSYVAVELGSLLVARGFVNALPGLLGEGSPALRTPVLLERLRVLAAMA